MNKRLLVTGYQSFRGRKVNGSATLVTYLRHRVAEYPRLCGKVLPVEWRRVEQFVSGLEWGGIDAVVMFGEGEQGQEGLLIESRAVNQASGYDEAGRLPLNGFIDESGPEYLESTLVFNEGFEGSNDAGRFLCNFILYRVLADGGVPAVFVHLPIQGDMADEEYLRCHLPAVEHLLGLI